MTIDLDTFFAIVIASFFFCALLLIGIRGILKIFRELR